MLVAGLLRNITASRQVEGLTDGTTCGEEYCSLNGEWNGSWHVWWSKLSPFNTWMHFLAKSARIMQSERLFAPPTARYCLSSLLHFTRGIMDGAEDSVKAVLAMCSHNVKRRNSVNVTFDILRTVLFTSRSSELYNFHLTGK